MTNGFRELVRLRWGTFLLVGLMAVAASVTAYRAARLPAPEAGVENRPIELSEAGFVTSRTCESCHPREYESWHRSYHRTMTQVVTPETVAAEIDGTELEWRGKPHRIERRDDSYWLVDRASGGVGDGDRIVMSTGSHSMQVFWVETDEGRSVELLPYHYLIEEARWIPRAASFLTPPGREVFGTKWNSGCIHCHSTRGQPRVGKDTVDTRVAEFGIACEACHGPGEAHIRANQNPVRRYQLHLTDAEDRDIVNPAELSKERASQVCGRCHGYGGPARGNQRTFGWTGYDFEPGKDLSRFRRILRRKDFEPDRLAASTSMFWADGMVRGSGREYGALLESPCFQGGAMSCLSCHTMHGDPDDSRPLEEWAADQLKPGHDGNQACAQCHPALVLDVASHSKHLPDSAGSNCYNCHMSYTTFGLLKAIRSHQVDSPSVSASLATGRPNACNQCHLDKSMGWAADHLHEWYGTPRPELDEDEQTIAASVLWLLRGDAAQRALMAWSMGWASAREASGSDWMTPYLAQLLEDPYPVVRFIAHRSLNRSPGFESIPYDFLASEAEWARARDAVVETWRTRSGEPGPGASHATLIDAEGELQREAFARLLSQRDDRPVVVAE